LRSINRIQIAIRPPYTKLADIKLTANSRIMPAHRKPTPAEIERMYDSGENRVTQERNDFMLPQICDFVRQKKWLNLRPEYQRRLVWDQKKKSRFIESLLMNVPVPPVFLYETDLNRYEVMDGQQRLNAILEFYEDKLPLARLEYWNALSGLTYSQCPPRIQAGLDRRKISANVLLTESIREDADFLRRTVFERLNTGGQSLNAQELRNSLYSGPFNDLIIELAGNSLFRRIWGIQSHSTLPQTNVELFPDRLVTEEPTGNKLFRRMIDCEIVLRFFAFREARQIRGSVRRILDDCMARNRDATTQAISSFRKVFVDALNTADKIFSPRTFQVRNEKGEWRLSQPLFDAVMVSIDSSIANRKSLIKHRKAISGDLVRELKYKRTYEIVVGKPNTAKAVKQRIGILSKLLKRHA
jgi:hypothetical protein